MLPILALLVVQILFGINYVASKIIVENLKPLHPLWWGTVRMFIAAVIMMALSFIVLKRSDRLYSRHFFRNILIFSVFGVALNQGFFLLGLSYTSAANSAIINTLTPIFTLGLAIAVGSERLTPFKAIGIAISFCGVLILRKVEDFTFSNSTLIGDIYTVLNCLTLAFFLAIAREFLRKRSFFWSTAWMFVFGTLLMGLVEAPEFLTAPFPVVDSRTQMAMVFNIVGATIITYSLNAWALSKVNSSLVALFIYIQPVVAVFVNWHWMGETPTLRMFLAILLIFCGLFVALWKKTGLTR